MMHQKRLNLVVSLFISCTLFMIYFIGWTSFIYIDKDKEIGKNIIFTVPMVNVSNIPENLAGKHIETKYGSLLRTEQNWRISGKRFSNVKVEKIPCGEIFTVKYAFNLKPVGILRSAFSSGTMKFYVLSSQNIQNTVILGGYYEIYTIDSSAVDSICNTDLRLDK